MNIKKQWVNDKPVRYLNKNSTYWVIVCDLAVAADLSPSTLHKYINNSYSDANKIVVGSSNACAVTVDVALSSINNLLSGNIWKRKLEVDDRFAQFVTNAIAFLKGLQTLATKDIFIRFVGTAAKLEWVAADVVMALYPNDSKSNYHNKLKVVSDKWKGKKHINNNGRKQEVTTIFKPGVDELIEHSNSARSEILSEWIDEQIEFETQLKDIWDEPADGTTTETEVKPKTVDEEAIVPILTEFMGYKVRFIGTQQNPEWVAGDVICVLYPSAEKQNYNNYFARINDNWKNKRKVKTNGGVQTVVTINEAGLRQLIARGNSEIAQYLQNKMFAGEVLQFNQIIEEIKEPATIVEHHFMGVDICFVGTPEKPEWIVLDILQLLYPDANEEDYDDYLCQIDSRWLDRVRVCVNDEEQVFTTVYKPGLFDLIARSGSVIAQPLRKRIIEQLDFINNSHNSNTPNPETDFDQEDKADDRGNAVVESEVNSYNQEGKIEEITKEVVTPIDFNYMGQIIRFVGTEDNPEWVAADPVAILHPDVDKRNRRNYLKSINPEWKGHKLVMTPGGPQNVTTLLESGLWQLTARSDSKIAMPFQKWLYKDVLPSIRKKGSYTVPNTVSNMLSIADGTFSEEVDKFAQFVRDSLNTTNFPLPLKTFLFVRTLREKFPDCKEFDILSQGLCCQDFSPYFEDIKMRTYHDISQLAIVYADKHKITEINKISIMSALIDKNLMLKDNSGEWLPTDCGKKYCVIGWHTLPNDILMPELKWNQDVLEVIGKLH